MKKKLILAVTMVMVLLASTIIIGCAPKPAPPAPPPVPAPAPAPPPKPPVAPPVPAPAPPPPAPVPAAPPAPIEWKGISHNPTGVRHYEGHVRVAEWITKLSGGRLVLKHYPGGAITAATKEFDGVATGLADYAVTPITYKKDEWIVATLFTMRVAGLSAMEMTMWHLGEGYKLGQEMVARYPVRILPPPTAVNTAEVFLSSTKPIRSIADLKGLKLRMSGDPGEMVAKMGAAVVFLPPGELYEATMRGVIDGFELSNPGTDLTFKVQEVIKYAYLSPVRQPSEIYQFVVREASWAKLTDDLKLLVEQIVLAEAMTFYRGQMEADLAAGAIYKAAGVTLAPAPKDIEDELVKQAATFYSVHAAKDPFYKKVLDSQMKFQESVRGMWPRL